MVVETLGKLVPKYIFGEENINGLVGLQYCEVLKL